MTGRSRILLLVVTLPVVAVLIGLGVWQLQRRTWKLDLIAQVERGLTAPPVAAPGPEGWGKVGASDAYRRLIVRGAYRPNADTFVQAVTDVGPGYWVMTPFVEARGFTLLVNRGFVPTALRGRAPVPPEGQVAITGLLRLDEPNGAFLHANNFAADRFYSRDVDAIAAKRGVGIVAPYFLDADAADGRGKGWPRGGLTVVRFRNSHLSYALTWFGMAAALGAAVIWLMRKPR